MGPPAIFDRAKSSRLLPAVPRGLILVFLEPHLSPHLSPHCKDYLRRADTEPFSYSHMGASRNLSPGEKKLEQTAGNQVSSQSPACIRMSLILIALQWSARPSANRDYRVL